MRKILLLGLLVSAWPGGSAWSQEVNPADNPLIGSWVFSEGAYRCEPSLTFAAHTQSWVSNGRTVSAPVTYAKSGNTIYVQSHPGSGGTVAYVILSRNEMMDTLGTGACHWKRQS
jgi:hypothetical protein